MTLPLHPIQRFVILNLFTLWRHSAKYFCGTMFDREVYTATKHMKKVQNNANTDNIFYNDQFVQKAAIASVTI